MSTVEQASVKASVDPRYRCLLDELAAFAASPPFRVGRSGCDAGALLRCVRKEIQRTERRAARAAAEPPGRGRDDAFHDVRKAAKRVRDAAETVRPLAPAASRRLARCYETVQDLLGERQDAAVTRCLVVQDGARVGVLPAHNGFTYGVLAEQERNAIRAVERRWPDVWRRATRKRLRRFLTPWAGRCFGPRSPTRGPARATQPGSPRTCRPFQRQGPRSSPIGSPR